MPHPRMNRHVDVPLGQPHFGAAFCMWNPGPLAQSNIEHNWGTVRVDGQYLETVRAATGKVQV